MSVLKQIQWLSSYDRNTGALSTHAAADCGYGDLLKAGYVVNRRTAEMPDLYITAIGRDVVAIYQMPVRKESIITYTGT